jgi:hypothetical protein
VPHIVLLALGHDNKASQKRRGDIIGMSTLLEFDSNVKQIYTSIRWVNTPGKGFGSKNAAYDGCRAAPKASTRRDIYAGTNMHGRHRYFKSRQSFTEDTIEEIALIPGQGSNGRIVVPCGGDLD